MLGLLDLSLFGMIWTATFDAPIKDRTLHPPIVTDPSTGVSYHCNSSEGVEQFLNIYFAHDTSRSNRFRPLIPFSYPENNKVDASKPGAACPQQKDPVPGFLLRIGRVSVAIRRFVYFSCVGHS
jgi:hypothetical protein